MGSVKYGMHNGDTRDEFHHLLEADIKQLVSLT